MKEKDDLTAFVYSNNLTNVTFSFTPETIHIVASRLMKKKKVTFFVNLGVLISTNAAHTAFR